MTIDELIEKSKDIEISQEYIDLLKTILSEEAEPRTTLEFLNRSYST